MSSVDNNNNIQDLCKNLCEALSENCTTNFAILNIYIEDEKLMNEYVVRVAFHNLCSFGKNKFADSGFDLLVPNEHTFDISTSSSFIDMNVKAEMLYYDTNSNKLTNSAYYIYPRSSISKTPLMLSNHTGIIDSGYRGSLICAFRMLSTDSKYTVEKYTRLAQICHPSLCPIYVKFITKEELSNTERGTGGFGSTGI